MIYLVTGGAGFVGSHIVDRLSADGHQIRILDDFSTGKRDNTASPPCAEIITGDVGDFDTVRAAMDGVNAVFHLAAIASVAASVANPLASEHTNYRGTLNVLEALRLAGTQRVIFASSAAVYGNLPDLPKREDMPSRPLSPYAVDKLASESAGQMYHHLYGLETVSLRYFNVFGPRQDPSSPYSGVISIFSESFKQGKRPVIYGDGEQARDFVYVSDVVEANIKALSSATAPGKCINIASGSTVSINRLLQMMCQPKDQTFNPGYKPARQGDIRYSQADISLAKVHLDWQPVVNLETGLRRLFND
jgi:UDP-glucose 4-epimerase